MGLAASQARLLFITSRQSDVSAQMQRISNQNMILARDEDEVSEKYNKMLSATTLEVADDVSLSYDALMGASGYANGGSIISDSATGAVVLSPTIAGTLGLEGSGSGKDFLAKYPTVDAMRKVLEPSLEASASAANNTTTTPTGDAADWQTKVDNIVAEYGEYPAIRNSINATDILKKMGSMNFEDIQNTYSGSSTNGTTHLYNKDNANKSFEELAKATGSNTGVVELLNDKEKLSYDDCINRARAGFQNLATEIAKRIGEAIGITDLDKQLASYIEEIKNGIVNNGNEMYKSAHGTNDKAFNQAQQACKDGHLVTMGVDTTGTDNVRFYCNVSDLIRRLLDKTSEIYCGSNNSMSSKTASSNVKDTGATGTDKFSFDDDFTFVYNSKGYSADEYEKIAKRQFTNANYSSYSWTNALKVLKNTGSVDSNSATSSTATDSKTAYFENLFNNLATSGWITDADANDSNKLSEKLKNNTYYINGQTASNSGLFEEKTDSDASAKAEAYWKTEMTKIQRKEKQLDTQLTKLQTEYSSLTNDYNSVKSILDANVQKSFTYCSNG